MPDRAPGFKSGALERPMTPQLDRRRACALTFAAAAFPAVAAEPEHDITGVQDFDELWRTLDERYCFFDQKATDWQKVRAVYRSQAAAAQTEEQYVGVLHRTLNELYDPHTRLSDAPASFPRSPPYDLWIERTPNGARITSVKPDSAASAAGLKVGDVVVSADGTPIEQAAAAHRPTCLRHSDPAAEDFAWGAAVAGLRGQDRKLRVRSVDGTERDVVLGKPPHGPDDAVASRRLEGGFGYIRIPSFADAAAVKQFDDALAALRDARGLLIDVRANGGGDTAVAKPIMGRFIAERRPYAKMRRRQGRGLSAFWTEWVEPRGPFTYTAPVLVLADRWSASMAEGFPMGLRGIGRARVVGTPMTGLGAAVFPLRLDRTGVSAQYSAEPVYDVGGEPRWLMRPDVEVAPGADILAAGEAELRRLTG